MIDRDGLFSPNAANRGEPDIEKLVYLSFRRNGMGNDVDARTLRKMSFYASLASASNPIMSAVSKAVKYDYATVGFGVTKEGFPFALLVPMSSLLYHSGGRDWSVCAVTMAVYWRFVSLKSVVLCQMTGKLIFLCWTRMVI